jgi:hypothetical protein
MIIIYYLELIKDFKNGNKILIPVSKYYKIYKLIILIKEK